MKKFLPLFLTGIFFLVTNTVRLWEALFGPWDLLVFPLIIVIYVVFWVHVILMAVQPIQKKYTARQRLIQIPIIVGLLTIQGFFPFGIINFNEVGSKTLLVAQREGAANCLTTFHLKEDGKFRQRIGCFGVSETTGNYHFSEDTVFFENISHARGEKDFYEYAVIKKQPTPQHHNGELVLFKSQSDSTGLPLRITKLF